MSSPFSSSSSSFSSLSSSFLLNIPFPVGRLENKDEFFSKLELLKSEPPDAKLEKLELSPNLKSPNKGFFSFSPNNGFFSPPPKFPNKPPEGALPNKLFFSFSASFSGFSFKSLVIFSLLCSFFNELLLDLVSILVTFTS